MIKFILILSIFSNPVFGMSIDELVEDVKNLKSRVSIKLPKNLIQEVAKKSIETSCDRKVKIYTERYNKYPTSLFYKWRMDIWIKRCDKERKLKSHDK
jgi:hypothetical protein